jgi:hypothetical protein
MLYCCCFVFLFFLQAISVVEEDIATYTIKAASDPRALNKTLHIRPSHNILTLNELVEKWEKKIGKTLEKEILSEEEFLKQIEGKSTPPFKKLPISFFYLIKS